MNTIQARHPIHPALRRATGGQAFGQRLLRGLSAAFRTLAAHAERRERRVPYF